MTRETSSRLPFWKRAWGRGGDEDVEVFELTEGLMELLKFSVFLKDVGFTPFEILKMYEAGVREVAGYGLLTQTMYEAAMIHVSMGEGGPERVGPEAQALIDQASSCFVATAACGDPDAWEVASLRALRDTHLRRTGPGRLLIGAYARLSPPVAGAIGRHPTLRRLARRLVVAPLARIVGGRPPAR